MCTALSLPPVVHMPTPVHQPRGVLLTVHMCVLVEWEHVPVIATCSSLLNVKWEVPKYRCQEFLSLCVCVCFDFDL